MAVTFKDYYDILGVSRTSTLDDIRQAYRKLARGFHPDVNPGDKSAEDKFKDINEAYEVLSDEEKRKGYDRLGPNWRGGGLTSLRRRDGPTTLSSPAISEEPSAQTATLADSVTSSIPVWPARRPRGYRFPDGWPGRGGRDFAEPRGSASWRSADDLSLSDGTL